MCYSTTFCTSKHEKFETPFPKDMDLFSGQYFFVVEAELQLKTSIHKGENTIEFLDHVHTTSCTRTYNMEHALLDLQLDESSVLEELFFNQLANDVTELPPLL